MIAALTVLAWLAAGAVALWLLLVLVIFIGALVTGSKVQTQVKRRW